jgi:hypothetical protein
MQSSGPRRRGGGGMGGGWVHRAASAHRARLTPAILKKTVAPGEPSGSLCAPQTAKARFMPVLTIGGRSEAAMATPTMAVGPPCARFCVARVAKDAEGVWEMG